MEWLLSGFRLPILSKPLSTCPLEFTRITAKRGITSYLVSLVYLRRFPLYLFYQLD